MPAVFISYRRSDSQDVTGRIYDRLAGKFTQKKVFKDVDNIPLGVSFPMHIKQMLGKSGVVLVVIGPTWLDAADEHGRRRLDDPNDFVRLEVEMALKADMPVIPILVSNTRMPAPEDLPRSMRKLASRNGMAVRPDPDFNNDIGRLLTGLDHLEAHLTGKSRKRGKDAMEVIPWVIPVPEVVIPKGRVEKIPVVKEAPREPRPMPRRDSEHRLPAPIRQTRPRHWDGVLAMALTGLLALGMLLAGLFLFGFLTRGGR